jgi:hypothetical protein
MVLLPQDDGQFPVQAGTGEIVTVSFEGYLKT